MDTRMTSTDSSATALAAGELSGCSHNNHARLLNPPRGNAGGSSTENPSASLSLSSASSPSW